MTSRLLYDPDCGFCTTTAKQMGKLRLDARIEPITSALLAELGVDAERATREIPFVDEAGRVSFGARAIGGALATGNRVLTVLGTAIAHPPVVWVAQPVYRWVAAHRHELPGGTAACAMPPR